MEICKFSLHYIIHYRTWFRKLFLQRDVNIVNSDHSAENHERTLSESCLRLQDVRAPHSPGFCWEKQGGKEEWTAGICLNFDIRCGCVLFFCGIGKLSHISFSTLNLQKIKLKCFYDVGAGTGAGEGEQQRYQPEDPGAEQQHVPQPGGRRSDQQQLGQLQQSLHW